MNMAGMQKGGIIRENSRRSTVDGSRGQHRVDDIRRLAFFRSGEPEQCPYIRSLRQYEESWGTDLNRSHSLNFPSDTESDAVPLQDARPPI